MIDYVKYATGNDLLRHPYYFDVIPGNIAVAEASMLNLGLRFEKLYLAFRRGGTLAPGYG